MELKRFTARLLAAALVVTTIGGSLTVSDAVSYTHLDVYKRQR